MNVFISYRRSDTQDLAGRLADRLRATPGIGRVFIDVEEIAPGADFEARIRDALAASEVCILLIGARWLGQREGGAARIFDERDFVRLEAAAAISSGRRVLPVIANDGQMPQAPDLPGDLQALPRINAISVRHAYFDHDVDYLVDTLFARRKPGAIGGYLRRHPVQAAAARAMAGVLGSIALLVAGAALHGAIMRQSLEESLGGPVQVWLLLIAVVAGGALSGALAGKRKRR